MLRMLRMVRFLKAIRGATMIIPRKAEAPKRHSGNALALNYISAKPSHPSSDQLVFTVTTNRTQLWESLLAPPTTLGPSQELYR